jgi:LysR family hydrogen peroxide-inducible transcriptional activator
MTTHAFSLRQLQYAVAVAETRSFHRAAERCHVSQPSLSTQLARLETVLGVRLFERDRRRVLPAAAAQELIERARRVLVEADDLVEAARRLGDPLAGTLRIGVIPTISPYLLPGVAPALRARYPRLSAIWVEERTAALVAALQAGEMDAAVLALEAPIGDVEREVIAEDPFVLAAPRDHPLAGRRSPAVMAELRDAGVLLLEDSHCFGPQALAVCESARAHGLEFRATSLATLAQMVAAGAGVTLLPLLAAPTEAGRARLTVRHFAPPAPHRTIALVWRRRSPLAPVLRQLAATMRQSYPRPALPRPSTSRSTPRQAAKHRAR